VGGWLFRLASKGAGRHVTAEAGTYRPTELAIGLAADKLYEGLPRNVRQALPGLPEVIRRLESDAQTMRQRVEEMNRLLAELGEGNARPGAERRDRVRVDLAGTRDAAQARLTEAVTALETVRLDLLRMHAGVGTVESVTADLSAARELSDEIGRLAAGHEEVRRLLASSAESRGPR
jgi:hypothetical protein